VTSGERLRLVVVAGSNGAGKSTLSATLRTPQSIPVLDPDAVARALRPDAPEQAATQAGRDILRLQKEYLSRGQSFAVETTLAGTSILRLMEDARRNGFRIDLRYIGLEQVQIAIDRIAVRAARGGHTIPVVDVRRRFGRSIQHLAGAIERADHVLLIDNTSEQGPRDVLKMEDGQIIMRVVDLPNWVHTALGPLVDDRTV